MSHRTVSGYDWVWFPTRIAIYMRDGWRCLACGAKPGERRLERLSLDHVRPDGGNSPRNLITLCVSCNSERLRKPLRERRPDLVPVARRHVRRSLDRDAARELAAELRPQRFKAKRVRNARRYLPAENCGVPF